MLRTGLRFVDLELASSLTGIERECSSATGTFKLGPDERITARSITFCNSRMLPGQAYWQRVFIVSEDMVSILRFMRRENFSAKCRTRSGMSSGRSRNGGA